MRLLLDTHTAVWSVSSSHRLTPAVVDMLADPDNDVFVSVISLWEIAIKNGLAARDPMPFSAEIAAGRFLELGYETLSLAPYHIVQLERLPHLHRDPFDRMLVAQANVEKLQIVSHDAVLGQYGPNIIVY